MFDDAAFHDEDDILGDVGGQIRNAFQVPEDNDEVMQSSHPAGFGDHGVQNFLGVLVVQKVHFHIPLTHLDGQPRVLLDKGLDAGAHHAQSQIGHDLQVNGQLQRGPGI